MTDKEIKEYQKIPDGWAWEWIPPTVINGVDYGTSV